MSDLDLVENYPREYESTQFEKVLIAAKRAKDLHTGRASQLVPSLHKHPYMALEEINEKAIQLEYREGEPVAEISADGGDTEDEEE